MNKLYDIHFHGYQSIPLVVFTTLQGAIDFFDKYKETPEEIAVEATERDLTTQLEWMIYERYEGKVTYPPKAVYSISTFRTYKYDSQTHESFAVWNWNAHLDKDTDDD